MDSTDHARLVEALRHPDIYPHSVTGIEVLETHISSVVLTGRFAYKIKKPLNLGFLDFSTLERRRRFCAEELRLNRRLAPDLYLGVVPIGGTPESPRLGGDDHPFEYAVKMAQFDQESLLDRVLARRGLTPGHVDELARIAARFHQDIEQAATDAPFGNPDAAHHPVAENFAQIRPLLEDDADLEQLARLEAWAETEFAGIRPTLAARKAGGFIRECHGDMHLGNMALVNGRITLFDGIEFNDNLRWIDVMSEVAFLMMDLEDRGRGDYAFRFLDAYLAETGDYTGLAVLRYYQAYRALVRAKVALIRLHQPGLGDKERREVYARYRGYANLAEVYGRPARPGLIITHGVSGSGKTTVTGGLVERLPAVRLRSDVERKRLFGLKAAARSDSTLDGGIYTAEATLNTYQHLAHLAGAILAAGFSVIVDATFLKQAQREIFRQLAQKMDLPFVILSCHARPETLRRWVGERAAAGTDASEAGLDVLERQLATREPLGPGEAEHDLAVDAETPMEPQQLAGDVRQRMNG